MGFDGVYGGKLMKLKGHYGDLIAPTNTRQFPTPLREISDFSHFMA